MLIVMLMLRLVLACWVILFVHPVWRVDQHMRRVAVNCLPWRQNGGIMATAITTHHLSWIIVHHHHHLLASCADDGVRLISSLVSCASDSGPDEDEDETMMRGGAAALNCRT